MNFIEWIQNNYMSILDGIVYFLMGSIVIVGWVNGPKAGEVRGVMLRLVDILRGFGAGTYKDEPGTTSIPFKGDTGERVTGTAKE